MRLPILLLAILTLTGCGALTLPPPPVAKILMEPCEGVGLQLANGSHAEVEKWAIMTTTALSHCAAKQEALAAAVKRREELYK